MKITAEFTASADTSLVRRARFVLAAWVVVAATTVACGAPERTYEVGEGAGDISGYTLAFDESGGATTLGRPTTVVERWATGCRQLFAGGPSRTAALLQEPCGDNKQVFAVTGDFWDVYRARGDLAPLTYGFPVGRRGEWSSGWTQGFGRHGGLEAFFMQRPGQQAHVVAAPMLEYYLSFDDRAVRFGFPTTDQTTGRDGRWCQVFEHAVVTASDDGKALKFDVSPLGDGQSSKHAATCPSP